MPNGNRFLFLTVAKVKDNKNKMNAMSAAQNMFSSGYPNVPVNMMGQFAPPQMQPSHPFGMYGSPPQQHHPQQQYAPAHNNQHHHMMGGAVAFTPQHTGHITQSNAHAATSPPLKRAPASHPSPSWQHATPPQMHNQPVQPYASPVQHQMPVNYGGVSSPFIGQSVPTPLPLTQPPVPTNHVTFAPPQHYQNMQATTTSHRPAANLKHDMSISSDEYTEQTVEENDPTPPAAAIHTTHHKPTVKIPDMLHEEDQFFSPRDNRENQQQITPDSATTVTTRAGSHRPAAAETPSRIPAKKSFLCQVGEALMTGTTGSASSNSHVSAHMRPSPKKYYGRSGGNTSTTVETVGSESSTSL